MNVDILQSKLENHPDRIINILEALDFENIKFNPSKNQFRFARGEGRNPNSCLLDCLTLLFFCFSTNQKGNLFTLIMDVKKCNFPTALQFAAIKAGIDQNELNVKVRYPFGGFYLKLLPNENNNELLQSYSEDILAPYANKYNTRFLKDGISLRSQEKFGVGYDVETNRITIPERDVDGSLVGIMGRANYECDHDKRWHPLIPCPRSKTLFGYVENYKRIQETGNVILFESEKAVQQCDSFGCNIALATCGCHVSDTQAKYIQRLRPNKVVIAYDEGLTEEHIIAECEKIAMSNLLVDIKVGYIQNNDDFIPSGSKMNIADLGKDGYKEGLIKHIKWLKE
jgi:DNA primase